MTDLSRAHELLQSVSPIWAMHPQYFHALAETVALASRTDAPKQSLMKGNRPRPAAPLSTQIIPVCGPLVRRGSVLSEMFGLCTYSKIRSQLASAVADSSVDQICLWVDSGGGDALGCYEVHADVVGANRKKPVVVYIDGMCASAAYWIASGAGSIISTDSAEIGSLGCFALHLDASRQLDEIDKVTPTFIVSKVSPRKINGNSLQKLSPDAMAGMQSDVDAIANQLVKNVAAGRRVSEAKVKSDFGQGGLFFSKKARAAGMIDRISSNFSDALRSPSTSGRSAAQARRAELAELGGATSIRRRRLEILRH